MMSGLVRTAIGVMLVGALSACGGRDADRGGASGPAASQSSSAAVVRVAEVGNTIAAAGNVAGAPRIEVTAIPDNATLETRLLTGASGFDVAIPAHSLLPRLIAAGALQPLDRARLPNWKNLDPALLARLAAFDPGNRYAVPYVWGTNALAYDEAAVARALGREPEPTLGLLFDPAYLRPLARCGVAWLDGGGWIPTSLAAIALGQRLDALVPDDLPAIERALLAARPYVGTIDSSAGLGTLANGEVCVSMGASGDLLRERDLAAAARPGARIRFVHAREGATMWVDVLVIPAGAPDLAGAHRAIDLTMDPAVIARISNAARLANAVPAATPLLDASLRDDPAIYPPEATLRTFQLLAAESDEFARARTRLWTRVRTGAATP